MTNTPLKPDFASLVVEHTVERGKGLSFRWWHRKLTQSARGYKGYIRTDLCSPVHGSQQMKWYSIVHFDTPEHLNQWLKSRDRESMIDSGSQVFSSYRFMSFATGLEGWFSRQRGSEQFGLGPPAWKQNLSVVLGLYPVVMIQSLIFGALGILQGWSLPSAMIINNLITSSILTWAVMPLVTKVMGFWLYPASQPASNKVDWLGTAALAGALLLMVALFNWLM
ncbi:MAG: hypothetical protein ACFB0E_09835 [Leptolyngbyaceae cyanobacterium]